LLAKQQQKLCLGFFSGCSNVFSKKSPKMTKKSSVSLEVFPASFVSDVKGLSPRPGMLSQKSFSARVSQVLKLSQH
jgi:hypothetical protein